jgi:glycosyltransferase involved in cell wall biosynthesis
MALGRAVVAADVPGPGDVVAHRTTGLLVRPDDSDALAGALRSVLSDPFRCEAWGEAGRDRVAASFDWGRASRLLEDAYTEAARAGAAPPHRQGATSAAAVAAIA